MNIDKILQDLQNILDNINTILDNFYKLLQKDIKSKFNVAYPKEADQK